MTDNDALLHAILDDPDDDGPRLVYADWLEEHGEQARAEFIRVECQLHRLLVGSPNRDPLEYRARQLLCISDGVFRYEGNLSPELEDRDCQLVAACGAQWAEPLAALVGYWGFRRGFVAEVGMGGRQFLKNAEALFRLAPVRYVAFDRVAPVLIPTLVESPFLARLHALSLAHNRIGPKGARCLAGCPHLAGLKSLDLMHCRIGDDGLAALLSSPHLAGLTALDLWNNDLSEASAERLATAAAPRRLDYLSLGCNNFGQRGQQLLRERFGDRLTFGLYDAGKKR
jgi:uncharacterized protein (TIGR02996 family)